MKTRDTSNDPVESLQDDLKNYSLIGDCKTAALVNRNGSIDWLCLPDFDCPSIFARLLDWKIGGHFSLFPSDKFTSKQTYLEATNILRTEFQVAGVGIVTVTDFMPVHSQARSPFIVRMVELVEGKDMDVKLECFPHFDYARALPLVSKLDSRGVAFRTSEGQVHLTWDSEVYWERRESGILGSFRLRSGEQVSFVLSCFQTTQEVRENSLVPPQLLFQQTLNFWKSWSESVPVKGEYSATLLRSALVLKLLTFNETGALIASPTTSLPEEIGGSRNWDYRFVWLRDASFVVDAFYQVGHPEDGQAFIKWVGERAKLGTECLQIAYTIRGGRSATEEVLDHLQGHRGSRPVRIGNAAFKQNQLDVYGEIINCLYICHIHKDLNASVIWKKVRHLVDWVCEHWSVPDAGIWEIRGDPRHFVYSKAMAWIAVDRAIRSASLLGVSESTLSIWKTVQSRIREEILLKGWNEELQSFVQAYGCTDLDAANLRLSLVGFMPADHPMMKGTIRAVQKGLCENDLVYRYKNSKDGVPGGEASFAICTCWLIQNLILLGEIDEAEELLRHLINMGGNTGLFSEEIDPRTGRLLGNCPQSFTHVGLINSIVLLERAKRGLGFGDIGQCHYVP